MPTWSELAAAEMESRNQLLRFADCNGDADGETALTGASEGGVGDDFGGLLGVGIGKNDDVILGAALALYALAAGGAASIDVFGYRRGADKADGADKRVIEERINRGLAAVDQVDDALRKACLMDEFDEARGREWHAIAGLQHNCVAGGDGVGKEPQRDHQREIERRDDRGDPQGLANHDFVDAGRDVFQRVALHEHRNSAGDLDVFNAAT